MRTRKEMALRTDDAKSSFVFFNRCSQSALVSSSAILEYVLLEPRDVGGSCWKRFGLTSARAGLSPQRLSAAFTTGDPKALFALGKGRTVYRMFAKRSLTSAFYRILGRVPRLAVGKKKAPVGADGRFA